MTALSAAKDSRKQLQPHTGDEDSMVRASPRWLSLLRRPASNIQPMPRSIAEPIEEELIAGNRLHKFHSTQPGDVLDGRYRTIAKLGYGSASTVWLAENLRFKKWRRSSIPRYVSVKISALDSNAAWEARILNTIATAQPFHDGLDFIRLPIDHFHLPRKDQGPDTSHSCLVFTPMRETLYQFQRRLLRQRLSLDLLICFMHCLLEALEHLHSRCHIIHTDIKDDNIMVTFESKDVLASFIKLQDKTPQAAHVSHDGRVTYLSQPDFGHLHSMRVLPKLADFNLAFPGVAEGAGHLSAIQSHSYRAPEVLLGCPWSYSVDIWNLGLLMWDLLEGASLFSRPAGMEGEYDAHVHLAQMVSLLGPPPKELIERERFFRDYQLPHPVSSTRGDCKTMNEFWGGPFFDSDGGIFRKDLVASKRFADTITELAGDEKDAFLDLASGMLQWLPEKRKTATELLQHPLFASMNTMRAQYLQQRSMDHS